MQFSIFCMFVITGFKVRATTSRSGKVIRVYESIDMNLLACLNVRCAICSSAINSVLFVQIASFIILLSIFRALLVSRA